jgi:glycosyltransferase involved in cell wall biosynthesis
MRILVISNLYPSPRSPSFGAFVANRVAALRDAGADVQVTAITSASVHKQRVRKYASLTLRSLAAVLRLRFRRRRVDIVETHVAFPTGLIARPVARLLGARLVLFAHGSDVMRIPYANRLAGALARRTYRSADLVVANSNFLKGEIERRMGVPADRVAVVSPGVDLGLFAGCAEPTTRRGFLFAGRLIPEKGPNHLIEALSLLKPPADWHPMLTIAGHGPMRSALEKLARDLGVDAEFVGMLSPEQLAATMHEVAIVVVPSTYQEPLGLVPIEAMASGAIVVATRAGGLPETVRDGETGFLVEPGDVSSLAAGLVRAMAAFGDEAAAGRIRKAGGRVVEHHDVRRSAEASLVLYGGLKQS